MSSYVQLAGVSAWTEPSRAPAERKRRERAGETAIAAFADERLSHSIPQNT